MNIQLDVIDSKGRLVEIQNGMKIEFFPSKDAISNYGEFKFQVGDRLLTKHGSQKLEHSGYPVGSGLVITQIIYDKTWRRFFSWFIGEKIKLLVCEVVK